MHSLEKLNQDVFLALNASPDSPGWQIGAATLIANYLIYAIPLLLAAMWLTGDERWRGLSIRAFLVTMLGIASNQLIGALWQHPRPFVIGIGHTFLPHAPDASFPSDHATVFASVGLTLLLDSMYPFGVLTVAIGVTVAWARIFLGLHFPIDMVGAAFVACFAYVLAAPIWRQFGPAATKLAVKLYCMLFARLILLGWLRP
jgi:undecaprenyl-diphosphatase